MPKLSPEIEDQLKKARRAVGQALLPWLRGDTIGLRYWDAELRALCEQFARLDEKEQRQRDLNRQRNQGRRPGVTETKPRKRGGGRKPIGDRATTSTERMRAKKIRDSQNKA